MAPRREVGTGHWSGGDEAGKGENGVWGDEEVDEGEWSGVEGVKGAPGDVGDEGVWSIAGGGARSGNLRDMDGSADEAVLCRRPKKLPWCQL